MTFAEVSLSKLHCSSLDFEVLTLVKEAVHNDWVVILIVHFLCNTIDKPFNMNKQEKDTWYLDHISYARVKQFPIYTIKLTLPCVGILMMVLSTFSDINRLITVAATLLSTGVVDDSEFLFRISFAVIWDGERVECSKCRLQSDSKCCWYPTTLTDLYCNHCCSWLSSCPTHSWWLCLAVGSGCYCHHTR